ncbi:hypothetical protein JCM17042A_15240 [Ruminococcus champanellensis 18P13 = JCM 17042]
MYAMQIVSHYPNSKDGQIALSKKKAEIHAQSIINRIKDMQSQLTEKESKKLVDMICRYVCEDDNPVHT